MEARLLKTLSLSQVLKIAPFPRFLEVIEAVVERGVPRTRVAIPEIPLDGRLNVRLVRLLPNSRVSPTFLTPRDVTRVPIRSAGSAITTPT